MAVSATGFGRGILIAALLSVAIGGFAYRYLGVGAGPADPDSPAALAAQARAALEAVKNRELKGNLRPARYDSIMTPLDKMILTARKIEQSDAYNPEGDFEKIRAYTEPVILIAQQAHDQAQSETAFLRKDYRFREQKGEACRYLASAMWNRLEAAFRKDNKADVPFLPSPEDSEKILSVLATGIDADPENKFLWYLRSAVYRVNGSYAAAEKDLRKALELDADFVAAWNDLGLTMINLRQFDQAEQAFVKAKEKAAAAASRSGVKPGSDYITALFNLAQFHEALASYYERAVRMEPTSENKGELRRHVDGARSSLQEIIAAEPSDSPGAREARRMLGTLPK